MKKKLSVVLCTIIIISVLTFSFTGCGKENPPPVAAKVTLKVIGSWSDCSAIEAIAAKFNAAYPECAVEYENVQNYSVNASKRLEGDNKADIFFVGGIQSDNDNQQYIPYVLDLASRTDLDLTDTFSGLIENYKFREASGPATKLYSIPLGAEMRGMYVNKTLLAHVGITEIPTNQAELFDACEVLVAAGYMPFQGNPGDFAQWLMYPWICNLIANAQNPTEAYDEIENRTQAGLDLIEEPFETLYDIMSNYYYDYKAQQNSAKKYFKGNTSEDYARHFFNINENAVTKEYEKTDDIGEIAFMPQALSLQNTIIKYKEDYHSAIEYEFIPAPISAEGGFAYLSPGSSLAINKNSDNLDWAVKFLNFLFIPENNVEFSEDFGSIPNTQSALDYIREEYNLPAARTSHLGQATFSYGFYNIVKDELIRISKGNNPSYMNDDDGDESTPKILYDYQYYYDLLHEAFVSAT